LFPFLSYQLYKYLRQHQILHIISFLERANFTNTFLKFFSSAFNHIITVNTAISQWYRKGTLSGWVGNTLVKWLYTKADTVVCCSGYIAEEMTLIYGVDPHRIRTIYNGIDLEKIENLKKGHCDHLKGEFTFIHVGSFYEGKNHALLLESFKKFIQSSRKANLLFIGKGYLKEKIKSDLEKDEVLKGHVLIPENIDNQYACMVQSDCLLLSSNFEGLPTVIMEAFACGLNVISTDCISGPRELLTEPVFIQKKLINEIEIGEYGILTPVNDSDLMFKAMCLLFDDTELSQKQKQRIEAKKKIFDINLMAMSYEALFPEGNKH
jgi:N-acetylgalactosamine-N,N'-diacetylbacillosaminyl-diphospho-undecaprenol 4-alpha-N-acetylgalactosaminyltransferase